MRRPPPSPPQGLLREILDDPERDHCPGARPVVSFTAADDEEYAASLAERARAEVVLRRRGRDHGTLVELDPAGIVRSIPRRRRVVQWTMRWNAARPIVRPGLLEDDVRSGGVRALVRLRKRLARPDGLADWLAERAAEIAPAFRVGAPLELVDPDRDVAKVGLAAADGPDDLWAKVGRLSTFEADRSLRLRLSFGREGPDDASSDEARHAGVAALFERLAPAGALIAHPELAAQTAKLCGAPIRFTQPIVYWNAPEGGALFHHDAFEGPPEVQQLGVLYLQLEGRTAWLALAIGDLALRVREFLDGLAGEDHALARRLEADELRARAADWRALLGALAEPGQGAFGTLCNHPEFSAFLADSGHAAILGAGDAIWLPNHGLDRTAMHSVFCASPRVATGLSLAIRRDPTAPDEPPLR